jgi:hypothetical protein
MKKIICYWTMFPGGACQEVIVRKSYCTAVQFVKREHFEWRKEIKPRVSLVEKFVVVEEF